jgi:hypothetical protein
MRAREVASGRADVERQSGAFVIDVRVIAEVATGLWRLRNRLVDPETDQPLPELGKVYRHAQAILDTLAEAGVEIQSHLNTPYDSGQAISAVAFQPVPGLTRETVVDTVRPSVYMGGRQIQRGEVVVGTPLTAKPEPEEKAEDPA